MSSQSGESWERRVDVLLVEEDREADDEEDKKPFTLANARGCMLLRRLAPPRGMMVLSTW